jgi:hypothetical protein
MSCRPLLALAALVVVAGCTEAIPPDPSIGFDQAIALPASAGYDELIAAGGRVLGADALRSVVATMGEDAFLQGIGGSADAQLVLRPDGAACIDGTAEEQCRRIVADGVDYRVFAAADGAPLGTLTPSRG